MIVLLMLLVVVALIDNDMIIVVIIVVFLIIKSRMNFAFLCVVLDRRTFRRIYFDNLIELVVINNRLR